MLGDFIDVHVRNEGVTRVRASKVGGKVEFDLPSKSQEFFEVRELNRTETTIRRAVFARADVTSIIEGHE